MSCNGCRVLRKGCSETCALRSCLQWIESPEAQGHATLFLAKFFGRSDLMSFISSVPQTQTPALFQSLLFEACGRTINPVNGAVGLLSSGNWHVCRAAVDTVLAGGVLRPSPEFFGGVTTPILDESSGSIFKDGCSVGKSGYSSQFRPLALMHDVREMNRKSGLVPSLIPESYYNNTSAGASKRSSDAAPPAVLLVSGESEMTSYGSCGRDEKKQVLNLFV